MPLSGPGANQIILTQLAQVSGTVAVTSTVAEPVWVSGTVAVGGISLPPLSVSESSVAGTGSLAPPSATLIAGAEVGTGNLTPLAVASNGYLWVTGAFATTAAGTSSITGTVAISNTSGPFGVSGSIGLDGGSFIDRRASGSVSGTGDVRVSTQGGGNVRINVSGAWSGTLTFEQTLNDVDWFGITALPIPMIVGASSQVSSTFGNGRWETRASGISQVRVRGNITSGSAVVNLNVGHAADFIAANVMADAVIDPNNTTTAILSASQAFTGSATDMLPYTSVLVNVRSDVTSALNGVQFQFSNDAIQWRTTFAYTFDPATGCPHSVLNRRARYFRVIYGQGAATPSMFMITTSLQRVANMTTQVGLSEVIDDGHTGQLNRSVIVGKTAGNGYNNVSVDSTGALMIGNTSANPVWITGVDIQVSIKNTSLYLSQTNVGAMGQPVPASGNYIGVRNDAGNLQALSGTADGRLWVTGNFATNFPVTQSVVANITQSVPLTVTASIPNLTASISNFPVTQSVVANISQSVPLTVTASVPNLTASISNLPVTQSVIANISQSVPLNVTASVANPVQVTGNVGVSGPVTFVSQSVTGTVSVGNTVGVTFTSQSITGTVSVGSIPTHGVTFVSQSVTGVVGISGPVSITSSLTNPVRITGVVETSITDPAEGVVDGAAPNSAILVGNKSAGGFFRAWKGEADGTGWVTGSVSVLNVVAVSQSTTQGSAIWVTGAFSAVTTEGSVFPTASAAGASATLIAGVENGGTSVRAARVTTAGDVFVTNLPTTALNVTSTAANPVFITGSITANSVNPAVGGTGSVAPFSATLIGGKLDNGNMAVLSATADGRLWVTGNFATTPASPTASVVANITQSIPLSVTATSANPVQITGVVGISGPTNVTFVSQSVTGTVTVGALPAITFTSQSVTGTVSVGNVVTVTSSVAAPVQITGTTHFDNTSIGVTFVSQSVTGTVTVGALPAITFTSQSVTGSVSVANLVSVSQSTAPASAIWVTGNFATSNGSIAGTGTATPFSATLFGGNNAGNFIPISATAGGAIYVSATVGNPVQVTGVVGISGPAAVTFTSQSVTGTVSVGNVVSVSQSTSAASAIWVTGTVAANITASINASNPSVGATGSATPLQATLLGGNSAGTFIPLSATAGAVHVTSTAANPIHITGSISANSVNPSVAGTGSTAPFSGTLIGGISAGTLVGIRAAAGGELFITGAIQTTAVENSVGAIGAAIPISGTLLGVRLDNGNMVALSGTADGRLWVTGNFATTGPATQSVVANITQSIPLSVTATAANPVQITGTTHFDNTSIAVTFVSQSVTGTVSIGNVIPTHGVTFTSQSVTGTVHIDNTSFSTTFVSQSVTGTVSIGNAVSVTATVAAPVQITGTTHFDNTSIATTFVSQSVTGTVSIGAMPAVTFVSQSVTGTVSIGNTVAVSQSTSAASALWVTGTVAANVTASISVAEASVRGTGTASPFSATLIGGNSAGTFFPFSGTTDGRMFVTATEASPVWVAVSGNMSASFTGTMFVTSTAAQPVWVTGTVAANITASVSANPQNVAATGAATPLQAGLIGGNNAGNFVPFSATAGGALYVSSTAANPVHITGSISANSVNPAVGGTGSLAPFSATLVAALLDNGNLQALSATSNGRLWVTGNFSTTSVESSVGGTSSLAPFSATLLGVKLDNGNMVALSGTSDGRLWVTGNFATTGPATQSVVANITQSIPLSVTFTSQSVTGTVSIGSLPTVTFVSQSVTGAISVLNTVAVTQSTTAASAIWITGSVEAIDSCRKDFGNSTSGTLAGNGAFTGTGVAVVPEFASVQVFVNSDVASAVTGVRLQFSDDNATWADASAFSYSPGTTDNAGQTFGVGVRGQYFRLVYLNGGGAQARFTASTILHHHTPPPDMIDLAVTMSDNSHAWVTKGLIAGRSTAGPNAGIIDVKVSPAGALTVDASNSVILFTSQSVTGTVSIGNSPTVLFVSQSVTGTVSVGNIVTVTSSGGNLAVTATVANPVQITGTTHFDNTSIATTFVSQSVTGTVSIGAMPAITFVSQSVTGALSVLNTVAVSQSTTAASALWVTGTVAANITASVNASAANVGLTGAATPLQGGLIAGNNAGTLTPLSATTDGRMFVSSTSGAPLWVTGTVAANVTASINASNASIGGTGSLAPFSASLVGLKDDSGNIRPLSGSSNGVLYVAISGAIDAVFSGSQIVTSTVANPVWITGVIGVSGPVSVTSTNVLPVFTIPVSSTVAGLTSTNVTNAGQTILTASTSRIGSTIFNNGPNIVYVRLGTGATFQAFTLTVASGAYYETPFRYTGIITAATSGTQTATVRCTDLLP